MASSRANQAACEVVQSTTSAMASPVSVEKRTLLVLFLPSDICGIRLDGAIGRCYSERGFDGGTINKFKRLKSFNDRKCLTFPFEEIGGVEVDRDHRAYCSDGNWVRVGSCGH